MLGISENIFKFRRKKGITQNELAQFLGVTKASVSKWETKQSYPDILLLPELASFFDVTLDELLGYAPQLTKEESGKVYTELADEFSQKPFEEVFLKSKALVKRYYSSYYFLFQMAVLWVNHASISGDAGRQTEVLTETISLCEHIVRDCEDMKISRDAVVIKALCSLQMGKPESTIEDLKDYSVPDGLLDTCNSILVQAYQMKGETKKADMYSQLGVYMHLCGLISDGITHLGIHMNDYDCGVITIERLTEVVKIYQIDELNPNSALQLYYQAAVFYCIHHHKEQALDYLTRFVDGADSFLIEGIRPHGDTYFTRMDEWYETRSSDPLPRNVKVVRESLIPALKNPAFEYIAEEAKYIRLVKKAEKIFRREKQ